MILKKYICLIAILALGSGCAVGEWMGLGGSGQSGKSAQKVAESQLNDGKAAFSQKLDDARGKSLPQLQKEWGSLDGGLSRDSLTVFQWRQTARLTPPEEESGKPQNPVMASCLAMFIVQNGVVVDATSEGQCFDYRLMPAWRPYITQSSDGRKGEVGKL